MTPGKKDSPRRFKDGKKLAFLCNESGSSQVWEMNPDGSGRKQLTQYEGDIEGFSFSPDGKKLLFHCPGKDREEYGRQTSGPS